MTCRQAGQEAAAETVLRDLPAGRQGLDDFLTFYDFSQEHWGHLRTSNHIESTFSGVRLRMKVTERLPNRDNGVYLVFKVAERLAQQWRRIIGSNLCHLVLEGRHFADGGLAEVVPA